MTGLRYDAGTEREELASEFTRWVAAKFIEGWRAERLQRRISRLARVIGRPRQEVSDELRNDARALSDSDQLD